IELVEGSEVRAEGSAKRAGEELMQESAKKQKEEIIIDVVPLAVKYSSVVDWKVVKDGKKSYYQIIRAYGSSKMYLVFNKMLRSFDREDLETLYKLVKARYKSTRPAGKDRGRIVGIKSLLKMLEVNAAQFKVNAAQRN
ncbi:hypothetical protein Tco_1431620, partial [Tanacetum coccineum]